MCFLLHKYIYIYAHYILIEKIKVVLRCYFITFKLFWQFKADKEIKMYDVKEKKKWDAVLAICSEWFITITTANRIIGFVSFGFCIIWMEMTIFYISLGDSGSNLPSNVRCFHLAASKSA